MIPQEPKLDQSRCEGSSHQDEVIKAKIQERSLWIDQDKSWYNWC